MGSVLSIKEAATTLGVEPLTVEAWVNQGLVPHKKATSGVVYLPTARLKMVLCTTCGKAPARLIENNGVSRRGMRCEACAAIKHKAANGGELCEACGQHPRHVQQLPGGRKQNFKICKACLRKRQREGHRRANEKKRAELDRARARMTAKSVTCYVEPATKKAICAEARRLGASVAELAGNYLQRAYDTENLPRRPQATVSKPRRWWQWWRKGVAA